MDFKTILLYDLYNQFTLGMSAYVKICGLPDEEEKEKDMKKTRQVLGIIAALCLSLSGIFAGTYLGEVRTYAESKAGTVIDVTEFGADPSGKTDSTQAVIAALEKAKETGGNVTVNFPKGEYHFWKDYATKKTYHTSNTSSLSYPEKYIGILLEGVNGVTLEGNGSSLIMHGDMMAIAVVNSTDVRFHDFVLDYKDPDTVDISIVGSGVDDNGKEYTDFYVPANYNYTINEDGKNITWQGEISPVTGRPYWEKQSADFCAYLVIYKGYDQTVARASDKAESNPFSGVEKITKSGENVLRFTYAGTRPKDQEEGNIFLLSDSATRKTTGAFFWESQQILVENIDVHYLSGFGWLTQMCKDVEFKGVDFLPRYGTGKYTTSNADQLHVAGCGGYFKVTDCNFSMSHDDPINVHGSYMRVEEVIDNKTLKLCYIHGQQGGFRQFHAGDEVLFYSRTYLEPPAGEEESNPYVVQSSIAPGEEYNGKKLDMRTEIVTFEVPFDQETLDDLRIKVTRNNSTEQEGLYVAENVAYTPAVTVSGNHMKSIPTRGILCTTRQPVIIENNVFDNMAMANIYLSNDADYWYESGPIRNMVIRNNKFYIRSTGQAEWGNVSGIFVDPVVLSSVQDAPASKGDIPVHRNITIEGNTFYMGNDNVVTANGVDGMAIRNNKIIRDDANIGLTLTSAPNIGVGESVPLQIQVQETTLGKDIFKFTNCKNVVISGNTYDEGLNLNVTTSGERMMESDIQLDDSALTLNRQGGNLLLSKDKVKYITSDPDIAYISEQGDLVGVSEGTVTLQGYVEWNGTVIRSNPVQVSVGRDSVSAIKITSDTTQISQENGTAVLTYTQGATVSVVDPVTGETSKIGIVNGNTYTALKEGIALVKAEKDGKSASVLIVNIFDQSYGSADHMHQDVQVDRIHKDALSGSKDEVMITAETGSELYGFSKDVNNLVKFAIPQEYKNDLRIQVDASGLPTNGDGYNNAGILLYKDGDNYYSIGKKGHLSGVTAVYEENASARERAGDSTDNKLTDTTFEIEIQNNTATMRYKNALGEWITADVQQNISNITGGELYLALCAWKNSGSDFTSTFGNVRIAKASETVSENMSGVQPKQIFTGFENKGPVINEVVLAETVVNQKASVTVKLSDEDGSVVRTIYEWTLTEGGKETVVYTDESSYQPQRAGVLSVRVFVLDNYGKPSQGVSSNHVQVSAGNNSENSLGSLYINGNPVAGFDSADAEFVMPSGVAQKIKVSYGSESSGVSTIIESADGEQIGQIQKGDTSTVIDLTDAIVIRRGDLSYTIRLVQRESSNTEIDSLQVAGERIDLEAGEIRQDTNSYFVKTTEDHVEMTLTAADENAHISAVRSFYNIGVENQSSAPGIFSSDVDLTAGINAFYLTIKGADNISQKTVRLYLFRDGHNESALGGLKLNGKNVDGFSAAQYDYMIYVDESVSELTIEAEQGADQQSTSITKDGVRVEGETATVSIQPGLNQIVVANHSENMWTTSYYTLNVAVRSSSNADLLSLTGDEVLIPSYDPLKPEVTEYSVEMHDPVLHLSARAVMDNARIRIYTPVQAYTGEGNIEADIDIYEGSNTVKIEATSPDGTTTRTYVLNVNASGLEYASDRMDLATKQNVGYGTLKLDQSSSDGVIALMDEQGQRVEFKKGLGAHASSEIAYNIEGQGYENFEAFVGIDYYQVSQGNVPSSVTFRVLVDGVEMFNSGEMTVATPMKKVSVALQGAKTIQLIADEGDNNYNDHADWADAKFLRALAKQPEIPVQDEENPAVDNDSVVSPVSEKTEDPVVSGRVQTGDATQIVGYILIMAVSASVIVYRRKTQK